MDTLVRKAFAMRVDDPWLEYEKLKRRIQNTDIEWGQDDLDALESLTEDVERMERENTVFSPEYERAFWLYDVLSNARYEWLKAHNEEIVADYQPSEFEIAYARLVFGDTDPGTLM